MSKTDDNFDRLRHLQIISKKELLKLVPYSDQHILRLEKAGKFPKRIDLGENRVGWHLVSIETWINSRQTRSYATDDDHSPIT
ncbi:MAG: helix-turn-helix transcriptional regulator [Hyphomicrobium sp.]|uniref:helix-turn-helix transcriptional regulator n=1 Tax=Hyphomicrobium sp. TaxID=82 RepID=UPI003D1509E0